MKDTLTSDDEQPKCFVFLDLEETCIDSWESKLLLLKKLDAIEEFLNGKEIRVPGKKGAPDVVSPATPKLNLHLGLMSWAVWNEDDKHAFNRNLRPHLESLLKRKFDDRYVWSMDDWAKQALLHCKKKLTREDLFDCFGKPELLFMLSRAHPDFYDSIIFLIDDAYEHHLFTRSYKHKSRTEVWNIDEMIK